MITSAHSQLAGELERLSIESRIRRTRRRELETEVRRLEMEISDLLLCVCRIDFSVIPPASPEPLAYQ